MLSFMAFITRLIVVVSCVLAAGFSRAESLKKIDTKQIVKTAHQSMR